MPLPNVILFREGSDQSQHRARVTGLITAMCLEPTTVKLGQLLRHLDDQHVMRTDDPCCDSCGEYWPCRNRMGIDDVAVIYGADLPASVWPS